MPLKDAEMQNPIARNVRNKNYYKTCNAIFDSSVKKFFTLY